jgi:thiol-disulfide isomerase/thioredoxin
MIEGTLGGAVLNDYEGDAMTLPAARPRRRRRSFAALVWITACIVAAAPLAACGGRATPEAAPKAAAAASTSSAADVPAGTWLRSFTGTTVDGKAFNGASLAGKPTVLWFWAPWCPTCLQQAPGVREAFGRYSATMNFLGVAGLDTAANMPAFVQLAKLGTMRSVADPDGVIWKRFKIKEQSYFVVLDASGTEVYRGKLHAEDVPAKIAAVTA